MLVQWFPKYDTAAIVIRAIVGLATVFSLTNIAVVAYDVTNVFVPERDRNRPSRHPRVLFVRLGIAMFAGIFAVAVPRVTLTYVLIASLSFSYYFVYLPLQLASRTCRNPWMSFVAYVLSISVLGYFGVVIAYSF